ncbi:MAG: glycoside hydrolase family 2 protein [Candidatus Heimdallarchaeaceae archaeon]
MSKPTDWKVIEDNLLTKWAKKVDPVLPFPEYPRPQFKRKEWLNLNGIWDFSIKEIRKSSEEIDVGKILVPFPIESALSGVKKSLKPKHHLWYKRTFEIPENWKGKNILLHFGAVDWETSVWVNDVYMGSHKGGYTPFPFDITEAIDYEGTNSLSVRVWDPTNKGRQERGKQTLKPWLVFYTAISGIWQTVWLEPVPKTSISSAIYTSDIDAETLDIRVICKNIREEDKIELTIKEKGKEILTEQIEHNSKSSLHLPNLKLWSPKNPFLYDLSIEIIRDGETIDAVESYFAMRKISYGRDNNGFLRFELNNEPLFLYGILDQGYWPDGLYTAPTDEALRFDIEITKKLGFNFIRKHIKVEPLRWYHHCDTLGMLVWQDIPNGGSVIAGILGYFFGGKIGFKFGRYKKAVREQYFKELRKIIRTLYNVPSIIVWVPFNEGWGQFATRKVTQLVRELDSSRLIDSVSGWVDKKVGDIHDIHKYPGPAVPKIKDKRLAVLGEFGGLGLADEKHMWKNIRPWAYRIYKTKEELFDKYAELITKTKDLILRKGLSAAVYTQITDVEKEVNGLLTYDRETKLDVEKIRKLNQELISLV